MQRRPTVVSLLFGGHLPRRTTRNKNPTPGDIRLEMEDLIASEQPLSAQEKQLVKRGYELFDAFYQKLRPAHEEMRAARKMRQLRQDERSHTAPPSMTLNSCIDNVIADQNDNIPEAIMVPERAETDGTADEMSDVIGFVLYQANWTDTYQKIMEDSVVTGTGVAQVFWDEDMMDGEGMANVTSWHPEDFYPDPLYENIQDGRACFKTKQTTVAWVEEHYPHVKGYVHGDNIRPDDEYFAAIDAPEGDRNVTLLEFWYKRYDAEKRKYRVHMAQMAGRALLYSTELSFGFGKGERENEYREGVYAHGQYPFVLYKYRNVWREPFGTGLVHDYRDTQIAIDRYQKYIDDNARESSVQRHFLRRGSGVSADQIADMSQTVIEWEGNDIREVLQTIQAAPLNGQVFQTMSFLVDSMKQDSGQNQFNRGEGGGGITAASAISQLVAQGGKITRWHVEQYKNAFREMVEQLMWVVSEYMEPQRKLLIVGGWESGMGMQGRQIQINAPVNEGDRLPKPGYSVRVQAQKHSPIWSERFNELLMKAAEIAAQSGSPIPAESLFSMLQGFADKGRIVRILEESSAVKAQIQQLQAQVQDLTNQNVGKQAVIDSLRESKGSPALQRAAAQQGGAALPAPKGGYGALESVVAPSQGENMNGL